MRHLTVEEIIDFVTMDNFDEKAMANAAYVTGHITECAECFETVRAFQTVYDEISGKTPDDTPISEAVALEEGLLQKEEEKIAEKLQKRMQL